VPRPTECDGVGVDVVITFVPAERWRGHEGRGVTYLLHGSLVWTVDVGGREGGPRASVGGGGGWRLVWRFVALAEKKA